MCLSLTSLVIKLLSHNDTTDLIKITAFLPSVAACLLKMWRSSSKSRRKFIYEMHLTNEALNLSYACALLTPSIHGMLLLLLLHICRNLLKGRPVKLGAFPAICPHERRSSSSLKHEMGRRAKKWLTKRLLSLVTSKAFNSNRIIND